MFTDWTFYMQCYEDTRMPQVIWEGQTFLQRRESGLAKDPRPVRVRFVLRNFEADTKGQRSSTGGSAAVHPEISETDAMEGDTWVPITEDWMPAIMEALAITFITKNSNLERRDDEGAFR